MVMLDHLGGVTTTQMPENVNNFNYQTLTETSIT